MSRAPSPFRVLEHWRSLHIGVRYLHKDDATHFLVFMIVVNVLVKTIIMKSFLLVFLGGGLGSSLRYLVTIVMNQYSKVLPFGTFTVNILGCLLIGMILGYAQKENTLTSNQILLLATGFCGGFTTFSAFANENLELIKNGEIFF